MLFLWSRPPFFALFETLFHCVALAIPVLAGLELRNPAASLSRVLGLKACNTITWLFLCVFIFFNYISKIPKPLPW